MISIMTKTVIFPIGGRQSSYSGFRAVSDQDAIRDALRKHGLNPDNILISASQIPGEYDLNFKKSGFFICTAIVKDYPTLSTK